VQACLTNPVADGGSNQLGLDKQAVVFRPEVANCKNKLRCEHFSPELLLEAAETLLDAAAAL
jgi:hypothetical protein